MKAILQSIKPQYCELIAAGKKTIEVRKTKPNISTPFKVYIYCTKGENLWKKGNSVFLDRRYNRLLHTFDYMLNGKVIGEYVCDEIQEIVEDSLIPLYFDNWSNKTCLTDLEMREYANGKPLYLWHISNLKIYDKPKELSEFRKPCVVNPCINRSFCDKTSNYCCPQCMLTRPPQSWCYVQGI